MFSCFFVGCLLFWGVCWFGVFVGLGCVLCVGFVCYGLERFVFVCFLFCVFVILSVCLINCVANVFEAFYCGDLLCNFISPLYYADFVCCFVVLGLDFLFIVLGILLFICVLVFCCVFGVCLCEYFLFCVLFCRVLVYMFVVFQLVFI